ncbi:MAG: site-2 protease family protein [Clostridia bacterium]|nr:site-2 protease family protein [Clostridia bacterium]
MTLRVFRTAVHIDFWFVAVITLMLTLFPESLAAVCFLMCILHEAGHLTAMMLCGKKAEEISLGYFGMKIAADKHFLPPAKEAFIAFSGPLINILMCVIFYFAGKNDFAVLNLALALFNLMPVTMLDGGHIISAFFPDSKIHKLLSLVCSLMLLAVGIFVAVYTKENFTIIIVSLYLLLGVISEK